MEIRTMALGSYQTNCYMAWADGADSCVVIDPGYEPERIAQQLLAENKKLQAILLTHGHFDHVGGVKELARQTGCRVYICKEDLSLNPALTAGVLHYTDTYGEGDTLDMAGLTFQVLHTPGHTPGSVCLKCGGVLFSGDTLFAQTCGRTDLPGGDYRQILQSLTRLAQLEGDARVLPGHGCETTLEEERRYNPFLRGR